MTLLIVIVIELFSLCQYIYVQVLILQIYLSINDIKGSKMSGLTGKCMFNVKLCCFLHLPGHPQVKTKNKKAVFYRQVSLTSKQISILLYDSILAVLHVNIIFVPHCVFRFQQPALHNKVNAVGDAWTGGFTATSCRGADKPAADLR